MIIVYCEDAPVSGDSPFWGMAKVNSSFYRATGNDVYFFCPNIRGLYHHKDLCEDSSRIFLGSVSFAYKLGYKFLPRIFGYYKLRTELKAFRKKVNISDKDLIFGSMGADINEFRRLRNVTRTLGLPYSLYVVDEILRYNRIDNENYRKNYKWLLDLFNSASSVFAITKGLSNYYGLVFGVKSDVVGLPKERPLVLNTGHNAKHQILHVGGTGAFYKSGLKELARIVRLLNISLSEKLMIRLTSPVIPDYLKSYSDIVITGRCKSDLDLFKEIKLSKIVFLPYDYKNEFSLEVATSFPSKSMHYLLYAERILYFGNEQSSFCDYFSDSENILFCYKKEKLYESIERLLQKEPRKFDEEFKRLPDALEIFNVLKNGK